VKETANKGNMQKENKKTFLKCIILLSFYWSFFTKKKT